jgi:hypothetical protein
MTKPQEKSVPQDDFEGDEPELGEATPSWFSRTYGESQPNDMASQYRDTWTPQPHTPSPILSENAAAYEAYRLRLEDRFASAQRMADPSFAPQDNTRSPAFPQRPHYAQGPDSEPRPKQRTRKTAGFNPTTLAILTLSACAVGGGAGYVAANPDMARQGLAYASSLWFTPVAVATETVITKKPVRTARLEVKDAAGAINSPIPLDLSALPADADTPVALRISGLPPSAYLTKGVEVAAGEWMVKAADFADTDLIVPHTDTAEIALQVAALDEKTGAQATPSQKLNVAIDTSVVPVPGVPQPKADAARIVPASAEADQGFNKQELPAAVPVPLESVNPEAQILITKGDTLLNSGDILAARQFYLRAFGLKATLAAYGVGQTFDPAVYKKFKIKGLSPDAQQASEWYGKAAATGDTNAATALAGLPAQP